MESLSESCRLPPQLGQEKTSTANVLRSNPAQSSLGTRCRFLHVLPAPAPPAAASSSPGAAAVGDEFDFISDLAMPLPVTVIAEMLGVEPERRLDFKRWSDDVMKATAMGLSTLEVTGIAASLRELIAYMEAAIARRRREPGEDLISALLQADEGLLKPADVITFTRLLLVAGNETTTNLMGSGMVALLRHPSEWERLVADASLIPNAVEEMLRYDSPIQAILRVTTQERGASPESCNWRGGRVSNRIRHFR